MLNSTKKLNGFLEKKFRKPDLEQSHASFKPYQWSDFSEN